MEPITRRELYMAYAAGDTSITLPDPVTREEKYLYAIALNGGGGGAGGGENGATFTPAVATDGTLSWTNDKGLANPAPVNIRGPAGQDGADGASGDTPYIGDNGNWFIGDTDTGIPAQGPSGGVSSLVPDESIVYDSTTQEIAVALPNKTVTRAEYDALSDEDKQKEVIYDIVDDFTSESVVLQNEQTIYSATDEVVVGRWIDGKPIYKKCVVTTTPSAISADYSVYDATSFNVDFPVSVRGILDRGAGQYADVPNLSLLLGYNSNTKAIECGTTTTPYTNRPIIIIIKYTKTTDTATIAIPTAAEMTAAYEEGVQSA